MNDSKILQHLATEPEPFSIEAYRRVGRITQHRARQIEVVAERNRATLEIIVELRKENTRLTVEARPRFGITPTEIGTNRRMNPKPDGVEFRVEDSIGATWLHNYAAYLSSGQETIGKGENWGKNSGGGP